MAGVQGLAAYELSAPGKVTALIPAPLVEVLKLARHAVPAERPAQPGPLADVAAHLADDPFAQIEAQFAGEELAAAISAEHDKQDQLAELLLDAVTGDGHIVAGLADYQLLTLSAWANGLYVRLRTAEDPAATVVGQGQTLLEDNAFDALLGLEGGEPDEVDIDPVAAILAMFATELLHVHTWLQTAHL